MDIEYPGMPRKKIIEGNTRNTGKIGDQADYAEVEASQRMKPLFAIVKHWPPQWQLDIDAKEEAIKAD